MKILGIETSCDETAAAVVEGTRARGVFYIRVLSSVVSSQIRIHKKYGGVVPEVAAREHAVNILPVVNKALIKSQIVSPGSAKKEISNFQPCLPAGRFPISEKIHPAFQNKNYMNSGEKFKIRNFGINAIAVTVGPGLITSLIVGVETAKSMAHAWNLPLIAVNHIEGHMYANFIGKFPISNIAYRQAGFQFPIMVLTVSGGHTMLVLMKGHGKLEVIGDTLDDAAGEAFDKAASMMKIGYPGGPAISNYAEKYIKSSSGNSQFPTLPTGRQVSNFQIKSKIQNPKSKIILPRPMFASKDFSFSFSGLKTALLYQLKKDANWKKRVPEYCHEFQQAVIDVLISKTIKAVKKYDAKSVMLAGGVAANVELRRQLAQAVESQLAGVPLSIPDLRYTTDNAAMVAVAGCYKALRKKFTPWQKLKADCDYKL